MIDKEQMRKWADSLCIVTVSEKRQLEEMLQEMADQLEPLRKDAARYRWIRSQESHSIASKIANIVHTKLDEDFDAAIDEAMKDSQ